MGLFLYPDQPILTASILDFVGSEVASTGLGLTTSIAFLMGASSSLFGGLLYETRGFEATAVYIAVLFAAPAVTFLVLPIQQSSESPPAVR